MKTKRLILRKLKISDCVDIKKNISKEIANWLPLIPYPYTLEDAKKYVEESIVNYKKNVAYDFGIEFNNKIIGTISLYNIDFKNKRARLAYLLNKNFWGKGIMNEAVDCVLKFGFKKLQLEEIYTRVVTENKNSLRILEKYGFKERELNKNKILINDKFYDEIMLSLKKIKYK